MKIELTFNHTTEKITATYSEVDPQVSPEEINVIDDPFTIIVGNDSDKFRCVLKHLQNDSMFLPYGLDGYIVPTDWIIKVINSKTSPGDLHTIIDNAPDNVRISEV